MPKIIIYLLLVLFLPILIVQAIYTRTKTLRLPEAKGERSGYIEANKSKNLSVLIFGDSAAAGVGVETQSEALSGQLILNLSERFNIQWRLLALTGETTKNRLNFLENYANEDQESFDYIVMSLGVNDVTSLLSLKQWTQQIDQLIFELQKKFNPSRIYWSALPPMGRFTALPQPLRWFIGKRRDSLAKHLCTVLNNYPDVEILGFPDIFANPNEHMRDWIASDGYHPGPRVTKLWADIAAKEILAHNQSLLKT